MKVLITIVIMCLSFSSHGQDYYIINAENGLNVRSEGNLSSKKVAKIRFGALVEKITDTDNSFTITDDGKKITGKFVKIKYYSDYFNSELIKGYVFDGFLTKQVDDTQISISKIDKETHNKYLLIASNTNSKSKKITDLDSIKTLLKGRVAWERDTSVKSILLNNGEQLRFNPNTVDFGFSKGQSGYYPEEEILVLEGGHATDVCFSTKTGETELTIGNPEYIIASPQNTYRLNGYFGGQECVSYFIQKYENEKFTYLTAIDYKYETCVLNEFYWISESEFIYVQKDYLMDSENGSEEYFKGEIKITIPEKIVNSSLDKIVNTIELKKLPIIDSTNFDNFDKTNFFNKHEIKALQLEKVYPDFYKEGYNYGTTSSYRIELSEKFHSIVLTTYKGEHEMESVLMNYDLDGKLIDFKVISYDEIAEGWSQIKSKIEKNRLTITTITWFDEKQEETKIFEIDVNGKIRQV